MRPVLKTELETVEVSKSAASKSISATELFAAFIKKYVSTVDVILE